MRSSLPRYRLLLALLLGAGVSAPSCSNTPPGPLDPLGRESPLISGAIPPPEPASLHALLINGGGFTEINFRSHRQHLVRLLELLAAGGVSREHIHVFASDGADPAPDLAILDVEEEPDAWLLPRSGITENLRPQLEYVNTELDGVKLRTASRAELEKWFDEDGKKLAPGDTLLLYVTDHGDRNPADLTDNTISLWGGEQLGVRQFQAYLDRLDPGVRVVLLMSQCFGGSFANSIYSPSQPGRLRGNVCGFFATTAERPAYGCYPQTMGREGVGHSDEIFDAWSDVGELLRAHRRSLIADRTPDVPNTSRDFNFARLMQSEAERAGVPTDEFIDRWLRQAWKDRAAWEPEIRLLDHIAHSFGLFSPRSLAEFNSQASSLPQLSEQLDTYADRWEEALEAARRETLARLTTERPEWEQRLGIEKVRALDGPGRDALRAELQAELLRFVSADRELDARLRALRQKAEDARSAHYRTEVRIGATLRIRTVLTSVAGRTFLQREGGEGQRSSDERLARCETFTLLEPPARVAAFEAPEALPKLADDRKLIESVMPSWMGIRYQPVRTRKGVDSKLPRGAVQVATVYPDSPAAAAGIRVADVVVGTRGHPFEEMHAIREWTMQSELGRPTTLELRRNGQPLEVTLTPGAFPLELPALPGPPKVGEAAPTLELESYRGPALVDARPRLLFFWATWCGPCKQSVPELLAYAEQNDVQVLAITDEDPEQLDAFFGDLSTPFPATVASDPLRLAFQAYGVSGTPTFVLIDAGGVVRQYQNGYSSAEGLGFEGWTYGRAE
jgi:thiol-disulfide isomerase/thioredoxin